MAFAGLKKQINKANQYVTEKMGGAEGTKLDMDFMEMKTDVTVELVEELQVKTKEYLQPNPTARAKMAAVKGISKLSGQAKSNTYPQPEGLLADCMLTYGKKLGDDSVFALALIEFGESLKQMADVKYSLDDNVKQNVLEPLHHLQTKDLKEVMHHRKKLQGRRLDFDCKRRRQAKGSHITDDEIRGAEDKFAESLQLAQMGMYHLLQNDIEQVSQLVTFSEALYDYHSQCADILKVLTETLQQKREEAESRPKSDFVPKTLGDLNIEAVLGGSGGPGQDGGSIKSGFIGNGNGGFSGGINDTFSSNNSRHYPPSRLKSNINNNNNNNNNSNNNNINSHHQFLYSSQQNLSTNNINNNNLTTNNNIDFKNLQNPNFSRNRVYGSHQSLTNSKLTLHNANIINNRQNMINTSSSATTISNNNNKNVGGGGGDIDLNSSYDWLNAWNNPPPSIPSATAIHNSCMRTTKAGTISSTYSASSTSTTSSSSTTTNFRQFHNFNSNTRNNAQINIDPWTASPLPSPMRSPAKTPATNRAPCCTALYDFEPENPGELGFKENDLIQLLNRVDENWYEGSVNGRTGYFPQSYVQVVVPLPN